MTKHRKNKTSRDFPGKKQAAGPKLTYKQVAQAVSDLGYLPKKRELALLLNVKGVEPRKQLKEILSTLKAEGRFAQAAPAKKESKAVFGLMRFDDDGRPLFRLLKSASFNQGVDKDRLYIASDDRLHALEKAEIGDQFFGQLLKDGTLKLIRKVETAPGDLVYGFVSRFRGAIVFDSSDRQDRGVYAILPGKFKPDTLLNHFVKARFAPGKVPSVLILEDIGGFDQLFNFVIERHGLPHVFSEQSLAPLTHMTVPALGEREDLRALPFVTIDGEDSKDFDDAVFSEPHPEGGWRLMVAIADVGHYVPEGSALDQEALDRGNSVYFPGHVIPMLPEKLSNDLCSLRPKEDRAVLAVEIHITETGEKVSHRFMRGLIHSYARLTYTQVEEAIQGNHPFTDKKLSAAVGHLIETYRSLQKKRAQRSPLEINSPELYFHFDEEGQITGIKNRDALASHQLIEEMMVLANQCAAETLSHAGIPVPYRTHEMPSQEKVNELRLFLKGLGIKPSAQYTEPSDFNRLMRSLKDNPLSGVVMEMVLRSQSKAIYGPQNIGHFGLNLENYCHFTSPIRRYADLLVHRALSAVSEKKTTSLKTAYTTHMAHWCEQISDRERRAVYAEREVYDRLASFYFSDKVGEDYKAYISGITRSGLFVTLLDLNLGGLVPMGALADDFYMLRQNPNQLKGQRHGRTYSLGDFLTVTLQEVDLAKGRLNFSLNAQPLQKRFKRKRKKK